MHQRIIRGCLIPVDKGSIELGHLNHHAAYRAGSWAHGRNELGGCRPDEVAAGSAWAFAGARSQTAASARPATEQAQLPDQPKFTGLG